MTHEKETKHKPAGVPATYLSLCSGYDGIGIALSRIFPNLRTLAHVEIEAFAIANLVAKMEEGKLDSCPVFTDVKRFPFEDLRGQIGILSAGFPCQPFSSSGQRRSTDDPRHIYPYIADGISVCRPAYVLLENVEGIISSKTADGESVLKYVLGDLEERGYTCAWGTFSAAEIIGGDGRRIPHLRKRVFILAKLADGNFEGLEGHGGVIVESEASERDGEGNEWLASAGSVQHSIYPARPNEPQNWWEEPRVVGDAKSVVRQHSDGETDSGGCAQEEAGGHGSGGGEEDGELADSRHAEPSGRNEAEEGSVQESLGESSPQDSGDGELADPNSGRQPPRIESRSGEKADSRRQENSIEGYGVGELADPKSGKPRKSKGRDGRKDTGGGSEEVGQLGDASTEGLQGELRQSRKSEESDSKTQGEGSEQTSSVKRPVDVATGEVVGDASSERPRGGGKDCADVESEVPREGSESRGQADVPETESELGGAVDAWGGFRGVDPIANRVDRLRLLGNGVCVDTCVLAFTTLYNRLNGDNNDE